MSGQEAQALDFYHTEHEPANFFRYLLGNYHQMIYKINFGRTPYDAMLALDPKKFNNLQMRVTIDIDGGGDEANDGYLTVIAHVFDQKVISPIGFLSAKQVKSYTMTNAGHEYTDLPTDAIYKQILLKSQRYGTGPGAQVDTVKLEEDNSKRVIVDHTMNDIIRALNSMWKPYREWIIGWGQVAAQYFYCTPCSRVAISGSPWRSASLASGVVFYSGSGGRFQTSQELAGPNWQALIEGRCPHAAVPLLPKFSDDIEDWYDVKDVGNLRLDVLGAAAVGASQTSEVVIQQLRKY